MKKRIAIILIIAFCLTALTAFAETEMPEGRTITLLGDFNFNTMTKKPDLVGLEDDNGKTVIKPQFDAMNKLGGGWWTAEKGGKVGLANTLGKILQKPVFDGIFRNEDGTFTTVSGEARGLLSTSGKEVIKPGAMEYSLLENGVYLVEQKGKFGLLAADGKMLAKPAYESIERMEDGGYLIKSKELFGLLSEAGKVTCRPQFKYIVPYGPGSFIAETGKGVIGFIDETGKTQKKIGESVFLGHYEQDGQTEGPEPIEWIIMENKDGRIMLLSRLTLDAKAFDENASREKDHFWEDATLRAWLNEVFLNSAFSGEEQELLFQGAVDNSSCLLSGDDSDAVSDWSAGKKNGNSTTDRVFLLSYSEVLRYFRTDAEQYCQPSESAAKDTGLLVDQGTGSCVWWTRTPGYSMGDAAMISYEGGLLMADTNFIAGVRPAVWIELSKLAEFLNPQE